MSEYRILLVEELVLSDSAEFIVNAETPGDAASQLIRARHGGLDRDSDIVRLPDGQTAEIKSQDVARSRLFCVLLDAAGNQIGEIKPPHSTPAAPCGPQPLLADAAKDRREPHCLYDPNGWEFKYSRRDRRQLAEAASLALNEIRDFTTLIKEPLVYAVRIPVAFDEDGWPNETEIRWRRDKRDANAALTLAWGKSPNPEYAPPKHSPWGAIDAIRFIAPGIFEVLTPTHGGIHLSPTLDADVPGRHAIE